MKLRELLGDSAWMFDFGTSVHEYVKAERNCELTQLDWELGDEYRMPALSALSDGKKFAEVCVGWCDEGILVHVVVQRPVGKPSNSHSSHLPKMTFYLDTRRSPGVHRGTTYCHRFDFFLENPTSTQLKRCHGELSEMQRARASPVPIHPTDICVGVLKREFGYEFKVFLKGSSLTGFQPREFHELGLFYELKDAFLGVQTMARVPSTPYFEDPSLWCRGKLLSTT